MVASNDAMAYCAAMAGHFRPIYVYFSAYMLAEQLDDNTATLLSRWRRNARQATFDDYADA